MDQIESVEDSLQKILLGPFLNTLTHLWSIINLEYDTIDDTYKKYALMQPIS